MRRPAFRKDISRRRWESTSKAKSVVEKICASGRKVTRVPVLSVVPMSSKSLVGAPRS
jgi:hypothetical protein